MRKSISALFKKILLFTVFLSSSVYAVSQCTNITTPAALQSCITAKTQPISIANSANFSVNLAGYDLSGLTIDLQNGVITITGNPIINGSTSFGTGPNGTITLSNGSNSATFEGNTAPTVSTLNTTIATGNYATLNHAAQVASGVTLPIQLSGFRADLKGKLIEVQWRTASELHNDYMEVERSANGVDFTALVRIKGLGTTDGPQDYQFTDHTPLAGINYYRLRQVDFDGTTEIHPTVSVLFNGETQLGLSAFPNPASSVLQVRWGGDAALETECRLFDLQGKLMFQSSFAPGTLTFDLPFQHLAPGAYALQMIQGAKVESLRVVKK